jgi:hypothetical protein
MAAEPEDEEDYYLPPEHQRPFTSGIRRKRVQFVRSSDLDTTTAPPPSSSGTSIADKYLSIVMQKANTTPSTPTQTLAPTRPSSAPPQPTHPDPSLCEICNLPLTSSSSSSSNSHPHESSIAHQVCLTHSHPPSHLDRTRPGLRYLSSYGWDLDARVGLGAAGREGIREPVKPRTQTDTAGLGTGIDRDGDVVKKVPVVKAQKKLLNAKQVRKKAEEERRRGERMRKAFHANEEVLKYLGEDV